MKGLINYEEALAIVKDYRKQKTMWTIKEFADFLGVSYLKAWDMVQRGDVKAVKIGNIWRIHYLEVVDYIVRNSN